MNLQNKVLAISLGAFLVLYLILVKFKNVEKLPSKPELVSADTYIPKGFVLVPIAIDSSSQISGLINQFAIVDLYAPDSHNLSNILVAKSVKLIRAPLNPNQFAVLVTEEKSIEIMKIKSPFWITLQNRNHLTANLEKNIMIQNEKKIFPRSVRISKAQTQHALNKKNQPIEIEYYEEASTQSN